MQLGRTVLQCDHRWTVAKDVKVLEKSDSNELDDSINLPSLSRWVTEEDLASPLPPSQNIAASNDSAFGLSNAHSESTDSGISSVNSVGFGQEGKEDNSILLQRSLVHRIFGGKMTTTYK